MIVIDKNISLVLTGNGDVLEPEDGIVAIGSGGNFALSAARALIDFDLSAEEICIRSMKIASKLCRTYTDRHGLKDLVRELLGVEISKQQQSSDWGADLLSDAQHNYAASDVLYLHQLKERLDVMLAREGRTALAGSCFSFLSTRVDLDLAGWPDTDIFSHE